MADNNPTTWMGLPNPIPGSSAGPQYALDLQQCMIVIDQHNHSPGSGQQIQPNGLNITGDLTFQSHNATALRTVRFTPLLSSLTTPDIGSLYVVGNELYYTDVSGAAIAITNNGTVHATSSGLVSAPYSASFVGGLLQVAASATTGANVEMLSLVLTNSGALLGNSLTMQAPNLSGGSLVQTLP